MITGGRDFKDEDFVWQKLNELKPGCLIQGGALGADRWSKRWAQSNGVPCFECEPCWKALGPKAGPVRNRWMLDWFLPDLVLAFPGGIGTRDAIAQARHRHGLVIEAKPD